MMYALVIIMSLVACVLAFISEVTRGNIEHIKHGRKPNAGAAVFPLVPSAQILAVLLAWGLNHIHPSLGYYTVIAVCVLLYVMWIVTYPKLKRKLDKQQKKQSSEPTAAASPSVGR